MNGLTIVPGLRRLWRSSEEIQFGTDPATAVVVHMGDRSRARVLDLLDGTRSEVAILRDAPRIGLTVRETRAMLEALAGAKLLTATDAMVPRGLPSSLAHRLEVETAALAVAGRGGHAPEPADALRRRRSAAVVLGGSARLAVPVAAALAAAGVGRLDVRLLDRVRHTDVAPGGLSPDQVGAPRAVAASAVILAAAPEADTRHIRDGSASFLVQFGQVVPAPTFARAMARRGLAHLLVEERDDTITIGPLVRPGSPSCVHCLDLHRRDRDPSWPALAAQLAMADDVVPALAVPTTMITIGVVTAQVLAHIDGGEPDAVGGAIEIRPPATIRRRTLPPHPVCTDHSGR